MKAKFDKSELEIVKAYENGDYVRSSSEEPSQYVTAADNTLNKKKNINMRISERDVTKIKARAAKAGIPYQTAMAAIMHKYAEGELEITL